MRHLLTLCLLLGAIGLGAQSFKGKVFLSGNTSYQAGEPMIVTDGPENFFRTSALGYFISDRLLVGTDLYLGDQLYQSGTASSVFAQPFVRYYFSRPTTTTRIFGQIGLLTFGDFGFGSSYETDFHFGAGAEITLAPDLVATGFLRYRAQAYGLNYVELALRLNVLLGGEKATGQGLPGKGRILLDPTVGSLQYGSRRRENVSQLVGNLRLNALYYLTDGLQIESGMDLVSDRLNSDRNTSFEGLADRDRFNVSVWLGFRKLLLTGRRFQPYLSSRITYVRASNGGDLVSRDGSIRYRGAGTERLSDAALGLGGGALYFLSDRVALDGTLHWQRSVTAGQDNTTLGRIGLKVILP